VQPQQDHDAAVTAAPDVVRQRPSLGQQPQNAQPQPVQEPRLGFNARQSSRQRSQGSVTLLRDMGLLWNDPCHAFMCYSAYLLKSLAEATGKEALARHVS
jgi:hypothetical protein